MRILWNDSGIFIVFASEYDACESEFYDPDNGSLFPMVCFNGYLNAFQIIAL